MVHFTSIVTGQIELGKNVAFSFANSNGCYIQGKNGIIIGDYTIFGPGVRIISSNHDKTNLQRNLSGPPIVIGKF